MAVLALMLTVPNCAGEPKAAQERESPLLTADAAGPVKKGMTVGEAMGAAKGWEFVRWLFGLCRPHP